MQVQNFANVAKPFLGKAAPYVPVIGQVYGITTTCMRVYNATSPTKDMVEGCKGIIIDCSPPVIKYPALCFALLAKIYSNN